MLCIVLNIFSTIGNFTCILFIFDTILVPVCQLADWIKMGTPCKSGAVPAAVNLVP